ncbi:phage tail tape measure protein [Stutzerimonas zhaodongensis]|uniref:Phage tail tape measure protein n=1 Tax=Stutzerimonas zhaodongensis TaxID=1176257 RepID=A0A3M2HSH7_9GAMM|nr:phage tail tape measure protein [Stutzerimonas zhaodongensis]MCQ4314469.1 phage tail tape measure protein [Stutzerimonas zhaodongensis]RMH91988.1 phage tail tape measure protein [Stutzerimonas zhaodongensis]
MARDLNLKVNLQALDNATRPLRTIASGATSLGRALKDTRGELKGLQALQKDVSSFRNLKGASEQSGAALQANREKIKQLSREMTNTTTPTRALTREFQSAVREGHALKQKHSEQQRELQGLRGKLGEAGISTRNLADHERELRQRVDRTNQTLGQQEQRLKRLTSQQKRLGQAKAQYERTQQLAGSMAATGAGGLASGGGMLYAGARMLAPGLEFDTSMSKVQALARLDQNSPELEALRQQARDLGSSTQFTAGQAADAQGYLAMAGFDPKAIQAAMPGMLDLAKAGDSELAETADIASNILTGFNLQASETGRLGDVLVGTFTRSNTNLQMLGETMKYAGPVAASVGQDIETVAAMAGKLGDAGIQGSMGGTALRAILNRLSAPPAAAAKALNTLGISAKDAQGNLRDMPTVLQEIYEKTKNMGDAERAGLLKHIAGEEAVAGMQVLVKQAGTGALQEFVSTLKKTEGEASTTARTMADNLKGDLSGLGSAWEDLGIQLQEQQNGPMREITQTLTGIIGGVKGWIAENPKLAANIVKTAAGVAILMAGMGGLTLAMASILGPFAMVRYGMMLFGIQGGGLAKTLLNLGKTALPLVGKGILFIGRALMMNPIGLAITAIAGGAYLIYRNWDKVGPYFLGLWAEIKAGFSGGPGGIAATILNFSPAGLLYRAFAGALSYLGVDLPAKFTDFGGMLMQGLANGIKSAAGAVKGAVVGAADSSIGWFKEKLGIHSPSRVFAELGGFTMAGLAQGLAGGEDGPLKQLAGTAKRLTQAGAVAIGIGAGTPALASADMAAIDSRPPLAARAAAAAPVAASNTYEIHIHAAPGQDANAIARAVAAELDRREQAKGARARSSLFDQE